MTYKGQKNALEKDAQAIWKKVGKLAPVSSIMKTLGQTSGQNSGQDFKCIAQETAYHGNIRLKFWPEFGA